MAEADAGVKIEEPIPAQTKQSSGFESPLQMPAPDWKQTLKRTAKEIKADKIPMVAAGMAFYWFLAIFPAIIAAVGILDLLHAPAGTIRALSRAVSANLPGGAGTLLTTAINNAREAPRSASLVAALVGAGLALWSASSGMVALQQGLDVAYDVQGPRKFVKQRLTAFGLILALAVLGGVPSPFFAIGDSPVTTVLGLAATAVAVVLLFAIFYYFGPNRPKPTWKWVSPGGLIGAVLWISVSAGFAFYVANFGKYEQTYGSLAGVVILLFWLYLSALVILVGAELNAEIERQSAMQQSSRSKGLEE